MYPNHNLEWSNLKFWGPLCADRLHHWSLLEPHRGPPSPGEPFPFLSSCFALRGRYRERKALSPPSSNPTLQHPPPRIHRQNTYLNCDGARQVLFLPGAFDFR